MQMLNRSKRFTRTVATTGVVLASLAFASCSSDKASDSNAATATEAGTATEAATATEVAGTDAATATEAAAAAAPAASTSAGCDKVQGEPIRIVRNTWTASAVESEIMKQLIETKLCNNAEIVDIDENSMFAGLSDGKLDLVTEMWPSGVVKDEQAFIDNGSVVNAGALGTVGQIGWFTPDYVVAENPSLATWEGLKDPAIAKKFATAETGDKGRFLGTDPSYSQVDEPIIANLGLPLKVVFSGSEAATVAELDSAVAAKKPVLMYWWTPTAAAGKYNLKEVKLPAYTDGCQADAKAAKCAYPADPLQKLASAKLKTKNPKVFAMFEKVQITNEQQLALLPAVEIDKQPAADVAAKWIADNEAVWSTWIA
jgi:glycine betaine/proline transport system substrate-binding protein